MIGRYQCNPLEFHIPYKNGRVGLLVYVLTVSKNGMGLKNQTFSLKILVERLVVFAWLSCVLLSCVLLSCILLST